MQATELYSYLSKLLGKPVEADTLLALTSGQRARLMGWLESGGVSRNDLQRLPRGSLKATDITQALGSPGTPAQQAAAPAPAARRETAGFGVQVSGIGIDMQKVAEIIPHEDSFDFRSSGELTGIFSQREIAFASARPSPAETLAGLFAAKEAILKASPDVSGRQLRDIEILPDANGAPAHEGFRISISHSGGLAVAVALRVEPVAPMQPAATPSPQPVAASAPARTGRTGLVWLSLALCVLGIAVYALIR